MVVVKRFHDCLLPTHEKVLETYEKIKHLDVKDGFLKKASGYQFYNISPFTFDTLKADSENIDANFRAYLNGFSDNVQDILSRMGFNAQIDRMIESGLLYQVVSDFTTDKGNMSPRKINAVDMGYIFENLVQRFSESYNEEAGAHFTSRDIIYLMCDLLISNDNEAFSGEGVNRTVYDMTMGTSQMLTCMIDRIKDLDSDAEINTFGQEFNAFTFGIAKAEALIIGNDADNMRYGNTLSDDQFGGYTFDYCISNPPFGIDWKKEALKIQAEAKKGIAGRFSPGLPPKSDGQMLFMLNGLSKLKETGRMAIIQNGSSLFTGDAGSGPSEIRRYVLDNNDWLEAIVQLPNDSFYNTGIATYVWIISKEKEPNRIGQVQLIDASKCYEPRRKSIGNKRVDITDACRDLIVKAYGEFRTENYEAQTDSGNTIICKSKVLDSISFGYNKIVVETPLYDEDGKIVLKKGKPVADTSKRDTENVPLDEDIDAYFAREVLPFNPDAWIDKSKTKVGYEIPFTRTFYEYVEPEKSEVIAERIFELEKDIMSSLKSLFERAGE
jgi:type I restriction enzyme M protein